MNFGTAYLDGSGIYGATPESADKLREFDGGFLKVFKTFFSLNLPHPKYIFCYEIGFLALLSNCVDDKYHTLC